MNSSAYWDSQYRYYMNNEPPKAESYYNQSFVDKINEAQKNIDGLVAEKDKSWAAKGQKEDEYNAFYGNMSEYKDVYDKAENEFGVKVHQDEYEKSKKALALAESTLSALPSSINSSSNRVLTQQQRENRYNALSAKYGSYRDNLMAKSSAYEDVWKQARQNQANYATAEIASQYTKLGNYNTSYTTAIDEFMKAQEKLTKGQAAKLEWEGMYRDWQHNQAEHAWNVWFNNMSSALTRWTEALNTEIAMREAERVKARSDREALRAYEEQQRKEKLAQGLVDSYYNKKKAKSDAIQKYFNLPLLNW